MTVKQTFLSSAELNYPRVLPTLDLNFAHTKTLDPRITFTRASGGSYVGADGLIKYLGINQARFDYDPETGESLGLLIEESRTNRTLRSEDFTLNKSFNGNGFDIQTNAEIAPDGTQNATKLVNITGAEDVNGLQFNNITAVVNEIYTASYFLRAGEVRFVRGTFAGGGTTTGPSSRINIDLRRGEIYSIGSDILGSRIEKFPNNWYRVSFSIRALSASAFSYRIFSLDNTGTINFNPGNIGGGFYIWGAQLEGGEFSTSYIPTLGSSRTRAADNASITGKNFSDFYNQTQGTIFLSHKALKGLSNRTGNSLIYNFGIGSSNGSFYNTFSDKIDVFVFGFEHGSLVRFQQNQPTRNRVVFSYNAPNSDYSPFVDGNKITNITGTNPYKPSNYNTLTFAPSPPRFNGTISRFTYYPKRLPNEQLQALTR